MQMDRASTLTWWTINDGKLSYRTNFHQQHINLNLKLLKQMQTENFKAFYLLENQFSETSASESQSQNGGAKAPE